jgi:serine/threonine protein kinase/tetratricopeptide (TPR) repeat protein
MELDDAVCSSMSVLTLREVAVFSAARRLPAGERSAYLDEACAGEAAMRQRLEELLRVNESEGDFLENPARADLAAGAIQSEALPRTVSVSEKPGDRIGRYKLLENIGEGGWGVVYVAEQSEPVRRRVALKVIKLGMDTKQVVARFEAERQALALMDHPNIAKALDAGATDAGRPYFVMELVRGIRITDYCDHHHLTTKERLGLFIRVCQAIQHAHQKGIIHRDIKPSNILVVLHDVEPVPKIIDFGIAKATEGRLTEATIYTQLHHFIGTPAYMSPEQAGMSGLDIDTRSDIYSLGVLLYELLAGRTPFDARELAASGLDAMRKTICEREPVRPSTRLAALQGEELTTTARGRSSDAPKLLRQIKGDLDWIVMKCLEKDRTRRYETVNGLAMDLERHLKNEPVTACSPSPLYMFGKMVRRNKTAVAAMSAVMAALVLGLGVSLWMYAKEKRARAEAEAARDDEARLRLSQNLEYPPGEEARSSRACISGALIDYRRGNYTQAAEWCRRSLAYRKQDPENSMARILLAMSDYQLHRAYEAGFELAYGRAPIDEFFQTNAGSAPAPDGVMGGYFGWDDARVLVREATNLLGATPSWRGLSWPEAQAKLKHAVELCDGTMHPPAGPNYFRPLWQSLQMPCNDTNYQAADQTLREVPPIVLLLEPHDAGFAFTRLGWWHLQNRRWPQAQANWHAVAFGPQGAGSLFAGVELTVFCLGYAPVLIKMGETNTYEKLRASALSNFGDAAVLDVADQTLVVCVLRPCAASLMGRLDKLADILERDEPRQINRVAWSSSTLTWLDCRRGDYTRAIHWAPDDATLSDNPTHVLNVRYRLIKALAYSRLGQPDLARAELAQCEELTEKQFKAPLPVRWLDGSGPSSMWYDWWINHVLLSEVKSVLEAAPNAESKETGLNHG